jgi:hypothetical protein
MIYPFELVCCSADDQPKPSLELNVGWWELIITNTRAFEKLPVITPARPTPLGSF